MIEYTDKACGPPAAISAMESLAGYLKGLNIIR
jgi:hypothetical protein